MVATVLMPLLLFAAVTGGGSPHEHPSTKHAIHPTGLLDHQLMRMLLVIMRGGLGRGCLISGTLGQFQRGGGYKVVGIIDTI